MTLEKNSAVLKEADEVVCFTGSIMTATPLSDYA